jgi:ribonucleoside-diphosphate reductase alpha chain
MVCLDMDHPEILDFIRWKMREEKKAQALIAAGYPSDFNGEAYHTVSGQNSNNSVRVTDEFMRAVETDSSWQTKARTNGRVVDTYRAKDLWNEVAESAWACADPGSSTTPRSTTGTPAR